VPPAGAARPQLGQYKRRHPLPDTSLWGLAGAHRCHHQAQLATPAHADAYKQKWSSSDWTSEQVDTLIVQHQMLLAYSQKLRSSLVLTAHQLFHREAEIRERNRDWEARAQAPKKVYPHPDTLPPHPEAVCESVTNLLAANWVPLDPERTYGDCFANIEEPDLTPAGILRSYADAI
jgi:hypothetical protein